MRGASSAAAWSRAARRVVVPIGGRSATPGPSRGSVRSRTAGLCNAIAVLYQLSYTPKVHAPLPLLACCPECCPRIRAFRAIVIPSAAAARAHSAAEGSTAGRSAAPGRSWCSAMDESRSTTHSAIQSGSSQRRTHRTQPLRLCRRHAQHQLRTENTRGDVTCQ